jgi:hypothetical protein
MDQVIAEILSRAVDVLLEKGISEVDICAGLITHGSAMTLNLAPSPELAYTVILSSLLEQTKNRVDVTTADDGSELPNQNAPSTRTVQ